MDAWTLKQVPEPEMNVTQRSCDLEGEDRTKEPPGRGARGGPVAVKPPLSVLWEDSGIEEEPLSPTLVQPRENTELEEAKKRGDLGATVEALMTTLRGLLAQQEAAAVPAVRAKTSWELQSPTREREGRTTESTPSPSPQRDGAEQEGSRRESSGRRTEAAVKLPRYTGKGELEPFLSQVQAAASYNGWSEEQTATHLTMALEGEASQALVDVDGGEPCMLAVLRTALEGRFGQRQFAERNREKLTSRQRVGTESLSVLAADIKLLARRAYPELDRKGQRAKACQAFLQALRPEPLQRHVRFTGPESVEEALRSAERVEVVIISQDEQLKRDSPPPAKQPKARMAESDGDQEVRWAQRGPDQRRCHRCQRTGHIARDCTAADPVPRGKAPSTPVKESGTAQ